MPKIDLGTVILTIVIIFFIIAFLLIGLIKSKTDFANLLDSAEMYSTPSWTDLTTE